MIRILPAIDIIEGQCVRLSRGDYDTKKIYHKDPLVAAKSFFDLGVEQIHVVDLDGAKHHEPVNLDVVEQIKKKTGLRVEFGGGVKTDTALRDVFSAGVDQVIVGSMAVKDPERVREWLSTHNPDAFIIGADIDDGYISINGWQERTEIKLYDFISQFKSFQANYFLCTDISKDGMLMGSSEALYKKVMKMYPDVKLIASGGVSSIEEIHRLDAIGCDAAIIGKALYEGKIDTKKLKEIINN